jgi:hypothetical protein
MENNIIRYYSNDKIWHIRNYDQKHIRNVSEYYGGAYNNVNNPVDTFFNENGKISVKAYKLSILTYSVRKIQWMNIIKEI